MPVTEFDAFAMSEINYNGAILFEGPSQLAGGRDIVVIITGLTDGSSNGKTGKMMQTWVLLKDSHPSAALMDGQDESICGDCPHRYTLFRNPETGLLEPIRGSRTCYVRVANAPRAIWQCYKRGGYLPAHEWTHGVGRGKKRRVLNLDQWLRRKAAPIRFGSYGDPLAAPLHVWEWLAERAKHTTGYTHQWAMPWAFRYKGLFQASCDSLDDYLNASAHGWRTFRVLPVGSATPSDSVHCMASEEKGHKTTCARCHLCDGKSADVAIWAHGATAANVA